MTKPSNHSVAYVVFFYTIYLNTTVIIFVMIENLTSSIAACRPHVVCVIHHEIELVLHRTSHSVSGSRPKFSICSNPPVVTTTPSPLLLCLGVKCVFSFQNLVFKLACHAMSKHTSLVSRSCNSMLPLFK